MPDRLSPNATIGILGGGQLGRMTALAAARLGYRCHILAPEAESPAGDVAAALTRADYRDEEALLAFAKSVDVVTLEFENVAVEALEFLAAHVPVRPGANVLRITQDRMLEKGFVAEQGVPVTPFFAIENEAELARALKETGGRGILKTRRMGYDGRGQRLIAAPSDAASAFAALGKAPGGLILEQIVPFVCELSVVTARGLDGQMQSYVPVQNEHAHHILKRTLAPAPQAPEVLDEARSLAERVVEALDVVGLLAVEMFLDAEGRLLVNELAPRPHNSGHWTMDACTVSQFEQLVRAITGLPLGDPVRHADASMENLLGDEADIDRLLPLLGLPGTFVHLYGKSEPKPGRKMGHVNRLLRPYPPGFAPSS
ncbi:5-(carboxyamino)imidazole ribonucleotide synthase [Arboricoccus pini]|uniref:N5-carboxyaminoimidazole ribonucleotide synthase n=1 Tax=Arboricoccus pini TaxID=1963835 RepID=A0A212QUY7_9PROT|nr:5-(carboxyamino)imidazole ribonucleotide synthase [Arboricoccus pini]SNB63462.1 5-(carboxyamino)imidazole ribonucleotide synthase [Arboricoccus pini]